MNLVILTGRISQDIDFKQVNGPNGVFEVAKFNLAVRRTTPSANGEYEADFFICECFRTQAQNLYKYCQKGSMILVEGNLKVESYEKDGVKKTITKIVANRIEFLSQPKQQEQQVQQPIPQPQQYYQQPQQPAFNPQPNNNTYYNPNPTPQPKQDYDWTKSLGNYYDQNVKQPGFADFKHIDPKDLPF